MGAFDLLCRLLNLLWSALCGVLSSVFGGGSSSSGSGRTVAFDDGRSVVVGRQIAEGGFSFVFEARDAGGGGRRLYALKRINCGDEDIVDQCRKEAGVHRTFDHPNLMPLLGMKFESSSPGASSSTAGRRSRSGGNDTCYMLFPYMPHSLREDITRRRLLDDDVASESHRRPYSEREALTLFAGVVDAIRTMHDAGLSHRDVKVENVLLADEGGGGGTSRGRGVKTPVLMDFGSAGPASVPLRTRSDVLRITEEAAQHTTLPYRAPELFDGGVRHGPDATLDYGRADVWSLGCLLFALMYGSSPFEIEWRAGDGTVRIVDCTHLKVLGPVPFPPKGSPADGRFGGEVKDLVRWMLNQARGERPTAEEVAERVAGLLGADRGGGSSRKKKGGVDPFDSIVSRQSNAV